MRRIRLLATVFWCQIKLLTNSLYPTLQFDGQAKKILKGMSRKEFVGISELNMNHQCDLRTVFLKWMAEGLYCSRFLDCRWEEFKQLVGAANQTVWRSGGRTGHGGAADHLLVLCVLLQQRTRWGWRR